MKIIVSHTLIGLTIAYIVSTLYLYFNQHNLLYFPGIPSRTVTLTPESIGLDYESINLQTRDGLTLDAWFIPADNSLGTLLFNHGNAGNISHRLDSIQLFHNLGLSILIYDYRGYGNSQGKPSETGTYLDAEAAWRYLTDQQQIKPDDIVIFGRSLGAAVAADLATKTRPRALIVESGFTSVPDLAAELYSVFPVRRLSRFNYPTEQNLQNVNVPVFVIHSRDDEIIPYSHGERLYQAAREPKHFLQIKGGHNNGPWVSGQLYIDGIRDFLAQLPAR